MPGLGYSGEVLTSKEVSLNNKENTRDTLWVRKNSSYVEYDFEIFSTTSASLTIFTLPTHPLNNDWSMRYGVSVDNGPVQLVDFRTFGRSDEWKQNVLRNRAERIIPLSLLGKGKHRLRIYAVDPGVMLDEILVDLGGLKKSYGSIPETKQKTTQ